MMYQIKVRESYYMELFYKMGIGIFFQIINRCSIVKSVETKMLLCNIHNFYYVITVCESEVTS